MVLHRLHLSSNQAERYPLGPSRTDLVEFNLEPAISCTNPGEVMMVRLESASIPVSQYVVNQNNNSLSFSGDFGDTTITLPAQNYANADALVSALNGAMSQAGLASLSCTYTENTHKISFVNDYAYPVAISGGLGKVIGMGPQNAAVLKASSIEELPALVDLAGSRSILVAVESFELDTLDSLASNSASSTNILAAIPVSVPWGSVQMYQDTSNMLVHARRKTLSYISIQLLDEDQTPYNLNGLPWSCVISVEVV